MKTIRNGELISKRISSRCSRARLVLRSFSEAGWARQEHGLNQNQNHVPDHALAAPTVGGYRRGGIISGAMGHFALLWILSLVLSVPAIANPYAQLAEDLVRRAPAGQRVGIGEFLFEDTEISTPYSALLRNELATALSQRGFRVVTRERLADLQLEGRFQEKALLTPGTQAGAVSVDGVDAIVRGRYFFQYPMVRIFAEVVQLSGGELVAARAEIPAREAGASLWAVQSDEEQIDRRIRPHNIEQSQHNIQAAQEAIKAVPEDFRISIITTSGRNEYRQGETISFKVQSDRDCYVAVFCHQPDGSTVLLFPNAYNRDTFLAGGRPATIPGAAKHGFEIFIGPPFGADVVQVIASTHRSELHRMAEEWGGAALDAQLPVKNLARGMFTVGLSKALAGDDPVHKPLWGTDSIVVSTGP